MSKLEAEMKAIAARVQQLVAGGMSRDRAMMLAVMEAGGKITIVKG